MNNILILGTPRSGTTTIFKSLSNEFFTYNRFYEPWLFGKKNTNDNLEIYCGQYTLIKTLIYQTPYTTLKNYRKENTFDFYKKIIPSFGNVILITRKDIKDASLSYKNALTTQNWFGEYKENKILQHEEFIEFYQNWNKNLENLSNYFNLKIWYYEDLFHENNKNDILNFIEETNFNITDIDTFLSYYDYTKKYRKKIETNKLI